VASLLRRTGTVSGAWRSTVSGGVTSIALLIAGSALAAGDHAIAGDRYVGETSQGQATTIVVSAGGRSVNAILSAIAYDGLCGKRPGGLPYQILWKRTAAIRRDGQFSVVTHGMTVSGGSLPVIVRGAFSGGRVSGTIAETGRAAHCQRPRQAKNPYLATFSARGTPGAAP
jgi:hypothetical protein